MAVLFKGVPYEELVNAFQFLDPVTKLIPHQKLSPETATYWRNLATYLHSESEVKGVNSATTYFENFMPELTQFCNYVRQHFVKISSDDDKEKSRENQGNLLSGIVNWLGAAFFYKQRWSYMVFMQKIKF